jgi:hypothetical protein
MRRLACLLLGLALVAGAVALMRPAGPRWTVRSNHRLPGVKWKLLDGGLIATIPYIAPADEEWAGPLDVRELATGRFVRSVWSDAHSFRHFTFSPDGAWAAGISQGRRDAALHWVEIETGRARELTLPPGEYQGVSFSAGNEVILCQALELGRDGGPEWLTLIGPSEGVAVGRLRADQWTAAFAGPWLLYTDKAGLSVWDVRKRRSAGRLDGVDRVRCRASEDGKVLLAQGPGEAATLWQIADPSRPRLKAKIPMDWAENFHLSRNGRVAALSPGPTGGRSALRVWDGVTGEERWHHSLPDVAMGGMPTFSADGNWLLWGEQHGEGLQCFDLPARRPAWADPALRLAEEDLPAGRTSVLAFRDGVSLVQIDLASGRQLGEAFSLDGASGHSRPVFTPDGRVWLTVDFEPPPPPWWAGWVPAWLRPAPQGSKRLFVLDGGRPVYEYAGRGLDDFLPVEAGAAFLAFHSDGEERSMSLLDTSHPPAWPGGLKALAIIAGLALLVTACWPGRAKPPQAAT